MYIINLCTKLTLNKCSCETVMELANVKALTNKYTVM